MKNELTMAQKLQLLRVGHLYRKLKNCDDFVEAERDLEEAERLLDYLFYDSVISETTNRNYRKNFRKLNNTVFDNYFKREFAEV